MGGNLGKSIKPDHTRHMSLTEWHQHYQQQVKWSQEIREHLLAWVHDPLDAHILEVGSGTGALLEQIQNFHPFTQTGVDIDRAALRFSQEKRPNLNLVQADGHYLPYPKHTFDIVICHFLLLWVHSPHKILLEMRRVTRPGGFIIALAEPDHEARIDFPLELVRLGRLQTHSLQQQGVDTQMGRKLGSLFSKMGLDEIETGILGAQWKTETGNSSDQTEWEILRSDLGNQISEDEFKRLEQLEYEARQSGTRVLFVPTFYAAGKVK